MKLSTYKTNFFEGNLIIYLLLFFSPLINFVSNNLFFFEVQYFKFLIFIFLVLFTFVCLILFFFGKTKIINEKLICFFFFIWFFQFYYRDIYNYFDLSFNTDTLQKYLIILFLIFISIVFSYYFKFKKFKQFIIISLILIISFTLLNNQAFNKKPDWIYNQNLKLFSNGDLEMKKLDQNIYYFLMDEMTSTEVYFDLGLDIEKELNELKSFGYKIFKNSFSNYNGSATSIGSLLNIDYYPVKTNIKEEFFYPYNLYNKNEPLLLKIINSESYNFWYLDNQYMKCKSLNSINCIKDDYGNIFLNFLFDEAINIFFSKSFINKFLYKYKFVVMKSIFKKTEIDYFIDFLNNNNQVIARNNNFFFIHQMNPHYPFRDKECEILQNPYQLNFENYLSSSECAIKKISEIINFLEKVDKNAIVIFQGDSGFSKFKEKSETIPLTYEVFNLAKFPKNCSINEDYTISSIELLGSIIGCSFGKKYTNPNIKKYFTKSRIKKIGTVLDEVN